MDPKKDNGNRLIVFLKEPVKGQVKTRLAMGIGDIQACAAYREMVAFLLEQLSAYPFIDLMFSSRSNGFDRTQWVQNPNWTLGEQSEGDLGERMKNAFDASFRKGNRKTLLIGSDCPDITLDDLDRAFTRLDQADLVIGPAADGGYWLIGMKSPIPDLFDKIPWSTENVLSHTLGRAERNGLVCSLLRRLTDIDTVSEWIDFKDRTGKE